jgi:hypothetical protein
MNNKRAILKQLLNGHLNAIQAASQLQNGSEGNTIALVVRGSDGLYIIGDERNLTEEQMRVKVKSSIHVILGEDSRLLAGAGPVLIPGKNNTVFILPDNGRQQKSSFKKDS